jgi:plastocyanin
MSESNTSATVGHDKRSPKSMRLIIGLVILLIIAVVISLVTDNKSTNDPSTATKSVTPPLAYVSISDSGFTPATLTVNKGTVVVWQAKDNTKTVVIASNPYPKGNDLKSLRSTQLGSGASYRYQFNTTGTFRYHDDLNPTTNGSVVVKEN